MIRLPHSSINLSEHDLAFHLQQIDIYHGLLKQGFKKSDIQRYFKEHDEANAAAATHSQHDITGAPSTVDLAVRRVLSSEVSDSAHSAETCNSTSDDDETLNDVHNKQQESDNAGEPHDADRPSPTTAPVLPNHRHAPRQSSLLRFAQVVSSDSTQSDVTEDAAKHPALPARTYRPRTETYSYNQSEGSEFGLTDRLSGLRITSTSLDSGDNTIGFLPASASPMRPDAETFVPEFGRQPLSGERDPSASPSQSALMHSTHGVTPTSSTPHVPLSVLTPRRSSLGATTSGQGNRSSPRSECPSSPPDPAIASARHSPSSPSLPTMPTTPTPARRDPRDARTEPRSQGLQYLDGSFPVYNDFLPPSSQPQTPAELSRHSTITEHRAAYTAPVGRIHTPTASGMRHAALIDQPEAGEQSPTRRAIGMRERRARELLRSARAEGLRLGRLRRQDRERMARGIDAEEWMARHTEGGRNGPGPAVLGELWEDQLEGDRVGDENWEGELEMLGDRGQGRIRVTSGNANAGRALWRERQREP